MTTPSSPAAHRPHLTPEPLPEGGWALTLQGRRARTPAGRPLVLPTEGLARIAAEDDGGPLPHGRRLAFTAIDRVASAREAVAEEVAKYAASDLLCYFAEAPESLVERQGALWGPWLDWAEGKLGLKLVRTGGVAFTPQPPESLARVRAEALELDDFSLTGLAAAAGLFGSVVLAFALQRGALTGEAAFGLSRLDETFQQERWGVDHEAAAKAEALAAEARLLERWLKASRAV
jgi:chaperone required for assembly of F1-ATPase